MTNPARYYETLNTPPRPVENGRVMPDETVVDAGGFSGTRGPQTLIRNLFRQAVIRVTAGLKVDEILYSKQGQYSDEVRRVFARLVQEADCGVEVENVTLNRVFPPSKTKSAFDEVAAASNTQSTLINKANEYEVETKNKVLAQQAEILAQAETYRTSVVAAVKAESAYFSSINKEYAAAPPSPTASPETVLMALYTSTLSEVLQSQAQESKFILGTNSSGKGRKQLWLKLNPEPRTKAEAKGEEK